MALKVGNANPGKITSVGNNPGGFQGSNYNPQQTAPSTVLQNPVTHSYLQPAAKARVVQPANAAVQAAAAAEAVRRAVEAERIRVKEVNRLRVQGELDTKIGANKNALKVTMGSPMWQNRLAVGKRPKLPNISVPDYEPAEYDEAYQRYYNEAMAEFEKQTKTGKKAFWQNLWDKASGGQDRREISAREYAAKRAGEQSNRVPEYDKKITTFTEQQAARRAELQNRLVYSAKDAAQYEKDVAAYEEWERQNIKTLEDERASITAMQEAFGAASSKPLTSATSKFLGAAGGVAKRTGVDKIFKYTLGEGSQNLPSLQTAPSRFINFIGNLNTKNRQIHQAGGTTFNRSGSGLNAWQSTFNQRNFNTRPWTDIKNGDQARAILGDEVRSLIAARKKAGTTDPDKLDFDKVMSKRLESYNFGNRGMNTVQEFVSDPLLIATAALGAAKGFGYTEKASDLGRASKATGWIFKAADKYAGFKEAAKEVPAIKWLVSEHKSPGQKLAEAVEEAKNVQRVGQNSLFPRINALNQKLAKSQRLDLTVFDELKHLSDSEARVLQRMVDGKITGRDRLFLAGRQNKAIREQLEGIATKWQDFTEKMRLADQVRTTRFGRGKKTYSPRTAWLEKNGKSLDDYNFRLKKKFHRAQNSSDFYQGAVDRYFKSDLDGAFAKSKGKKRAAMESERKALVEEYDNMINPARANVEKAYKKTRTPWARARGVVGAPLRAWKHSVLARPAWTVNNVAANTSGATLAGGATALAEQAKMINPRYWRKAMDESRSVFGSNAGKEFPKGRGALSKWYNFNTGLEDWSRVAAGRAGLKKGLTEEQSLKRVNKYLFDYTTKNWERPLKTVVPFWSWQKNLSKAAVKMPFDRPAGAAAYNRLDRYQQQQYDREFDKTVGKLKELGYTDEEIETFRKENAKYYAGRLKIGDKWITTPFNPFSEQGLGNMGINPYLAAAGETANAKDQYGKELKGSEANFWNRLGSKFPQLALGKQAKKAWDLQKGKSKPVDRWVSKPGHDGYGLTKEQQGYDTSKTNYDSSMDARRGLGQNALAFLGVPKSMKFDTNEFLKRKTLQKVKDEYFKKDWDSIEDYTERTNQQEALFKKYGMTADDFYKGELAKNDSSNTTAIKAKKEEARLKNKALWDEYHKQPQGTRNAWATKKIRQLVDDGYFNDNPWLKGFKYMTPDTVKKADKQMNYVVSQKKKDYDEAKRTGNWAAYTAKYGVKSQKAKDYRRAMETGDWTDYRRKYGVSSKPTPFKFDGKYFKTAKTMDSYKTGQFWYKYANATQDGRKKLLADNPEFNTRGNWSKSEWDAWRVDRKKKQVATARGYGNIAGFMGSAVKDNQSNATRFLSGKIGRKNKVVWKV